MEGLIYGNTNKRGRMPVEKGERRYVRNWKNNLGNAERKAM